MTVARAGPTSAISRKNKMNATAVHTSASPNTDQMTLALSWLGHSVAATGAYPIAVKPNDAATTPSVGRSESCREIRMGPVAYPIAVMPIATTAQASLPFTSTPTSTTTPPSPIRRPANRRPSSLS